MAMVELDIAREIVLLGFGAFLLTLGVSMVLVVSASREGLKNFFNRDRKNQS
jgi:hypothetical protein